jgi:hypothetical protein
VLNIYLVRLQIHLPPLTSIQAPVMFEASSLAREHAAFATSVTCVNLPIGIELSMTPLVVAAWHRRSGNQGKDGGRSRPTEGAGRATRRGRQRRPGRNKEWWREKAAWWRGAGTL